MPLAAGDRYELALNGEGRPTFNSLPAILSLLDSEETEQRAEGASYLAQLVDSSHGDDATIFSDYLREAGGIEVIAELLLDPEPFIIQKVLMVVGNLASDAFDPNSEANKAIFKQHDVMARLFPFLSSREWVTQLYATAAVQNLSKDIDLAKEALQLGVHKVVQRLIRSEHELVVRYGARCPGSSSAKMRASLRRSQPPCPCEHAVARPLCCAGATATTPLTWLSAAAGALKNLQDARELEIEEARGNAESGGSRRSCEEVALARAARPIIQPARHLPPPSPPPRLLQPARPAPTCTLHACTSQRGSRR